MMLGFTVFGLRVPDARRSLVPLVIFSVSASPMFGITAKSATGLHSTERFAIEHRSTYPVLLK